MDLIDSLEASFAHAHQVVSGVRRDQYDEQTPCSEWKVRDLLEHLIGTVGGIGAAAAGERPEPFTLGDDPAAQFEQASKAAVRAWRAPGVLDSTIDAGAGPMPGSVLASISLLDTATHSWDLATATGQPAELPSNVAVAAMEASRMIVRDEMRPGRFDPEQVAPTDATDTQRLVAFLGRTP